MTNELYPFTGEDRLLTPNTYSYTKYFGIQFLDAYLNDRTEALSALGQPVPPPPPRPLAEEQFTTPVIQTNVLLEKLLDTIDSGSAKQDDFRLVNQLLRQFEIRKIIYPAYTSKWRPIGQHNTVPKETYVRFAEVINSSYCVWGKLPQLNVLLKIIDTLITIRKYLSCDEKGRQAWLIKCEIEHIRSLARRKGINF